MSTILKYLLSIVGYVWGSFWSIIALVLWFLPMWAAGQMRPLRWSADGVWDWVIIPGSRWAGYYSVRGNWIATTFGHIIMWSSGHQDNLVYRSHELRHVWQYSVLGPLFMPAYLVCQAIWGYWMNPFEVDARVHQLPQPPTVPEPVTEMKCDSLCQICNPVGPLPTESITG